MTTPTPPTGNPAGRILSSPRELAAWALVGYVALVLFFEFFQWILPGGTFSGRSANADFRSLLIMGMPVLAVLLAAHVSPVIGSARMIAAIALAEYAFALFFGLVTLLIGLGAVFDSVDDASESFGALGYLVLGIAGLGLMTVAALVVWRAFSSLGGKLPIPQSRTAPPAA